MAEQTMATARAQARERGFRANRAFIVESLVLLAFLALAVALVLQLFAAAGIASYKSHAQSVVMQLAGNTAERFAADPASVSEDLYYDDEGKLVSQDALAAAYRVESNVAGSNTGTGTLYHAQIQVVPVSNTFLEGPYTLETSRYVPGDTVGSRAGSAAGTAASSGVAGAADAAGAAGIAGAVGAADATSAAEATGGAQ